MRRVEITYERSPLAILGAGRLGSAIAWRWQAVEDQKPDLWSRRFEGVDPVEIHGWFFPAGERPYTVASIAEVTSASTLVAAIPSSALAELAARYPEIGGFAGTLLVTGTDCLWEAAQQLTPAALVVRVVPSLLSAPRSLPSLVLDHGLPQARWEPTRAILAKLGPIHYVDDEQAFESLMYLTSPFPVVLRSALADAVASTLTQTGVAPKWQPLAERLLWEALSAMSAAQPRPESIEAAVATPGGVTAAGLEDVPAISRALQDLWQLLIRTGARTRDR